MSRYQHPNTALAAALAFVVVVAAIAGTARAAVNRKAREGLEQIPEANPLPHDVLHLRNNDKISGTLLRFEDNAFVVEGELLDGEVRVPIQNVALALLRTHDELPESPSGRLVFPNGDRLSVTVERISDGIVKASTAAGEAIEVKTERLTGLIFERKPFTVYENDFESAELKGLRPASGTWVIEDGVLTQKERNASFSNVVLELTQDGRFEYEWVCNLVAGYSYGFYLFAENGQSVNGGTSYLIMAQGQSIYLYKVQNDNQQYYATYRLPKRIARARFKLDYDPGTGNIILTIDGEDVFRYRDPEPIGAGRYVILRVDSVGSFDDLAIRRLGGGRLLATEAKARGRDIVCLANNDEVSGTVLAVDDATVLVKTEYDQDPVDIAREVVSSLTFYRQAFTATEPGTFLVTLVNNDHLTGRLIHLDAETVMLETSIVGRITLARALVREIRASDAEDEAVGQLDEEPGAAPRLRREGIVNVEGVFRVNGENGEKVRVIAIEGGKAHIVNDQD